MTDLTRHLSGGSNTLNTVVVQLEPLFSSCMAFTNNSCILTILGIEQLLRIQAEHQRKIDSWRFFQSLHDGETYD